MKKQLRLEYKDGGRTKLTNAKAMDNTVFANYFRQITLPAILNAGIYTYPLKVNEPFILVEDGVVRKDNIKMLIGD
ncbi:MAG: hypothetical protein ACRDBO_00105 [Lachnospiraceae bacterium]